jgi:hypothetical protein
MRSNKTQQHKLKHTNLVLVDLAISVAESVLAYVVIIQETRSAVSFSVPGVEHAFLLLFRNLRVLIVVVVFAVVSLLLAPSPAPLTKKRLYERGMLERMRTLFYVCGSRWQHALYVEILKMIFAVVHIFQISHWMVSSTASGPKKHCGAHNQCTAACTGWKPIPGLLFFIRFIFTGLIVDIL